MSSQSFRGGLWNAARALVAFWAVVALSTSAFAGNGPHNFLVVYDPGDPNSVAIARHYQQARQFPDVQMMAYSFPRVAAGTGGIASSIQTTDAWNFIGAVRAYIAARGLGGQIHGVTLVGLAPTSMAKSSILTTASSITTGLAMSPGLSDRSTWEYRVDGNNGLFRNYGVNALPTTEIRSDLDFTGGRYWLATHLGYTGLAGLTAEEMCGVIDRAVSADGTAPAGTVYWPLNNDVRSTTREGQITEVQSEWDSLGLRYNIYGLGKGGVTTAQSIPKDKTGALGSYPVANRAIQGAVIGAANFDLETNKNIYVPGAICDHLTSYGGVMGGSFVSGQTVISEWLRWGAAGSTGTVVEPYAIWEKFPHARVHSHYFRGATLAEAYQQSISYPVQTLIMGEPLCQPYAKVPKVQISSPVGGQVLSGTVSVLAAVDPGVAVEGNLDLAVDGRVIRIGNPGETVSVVRISGGFTLDTATLSDGWHELRVIAYGADAIRAQGFAKREITVANQASSVSLSGPGTAQFDGTFSVTASVSGVQNVSRVEVRSLGQVLATLPASGGTAQIAANTLSYRDPNRLFAVAVTAGGAEIASAPLEVAVTWTPKSALASPATVSGALAVARYFSDTTTPGFDWSGSPQATGYVDDRYLLNFTNGNYPLVTAGSGAGTKGGLELVTLLSVREEGVYDFAFRSNPGLAVLLDGEQLVPACSPAGGVVHASKPLAAGWHELRVRLRFVTGKNDFTAGFRGRYTKNKDEYTSLVYGFDYFGLDHCAAPGSPALTQPALVARAVSASQVDLTWTDPVASETSWLVQQLAGEPDITLASYLGTATAPVLEARRSPGSIRPLGRVDNDTTELWNEVPTFLQDGVRLRTAKADNADKGVNILYRVNVPAGFTIYALQNANLDTLKPTWMDAQGWTFVSDGWSSDTSLSWRLWKRTALTAGGTVDLGGPRDKAGAISFVFVKEPVWTTVATLPANSTSYSMTGLGAGSYTLRVSAQVLPGASMPSNERVVDTRLPVSNIAPVVNAGPDIVTVLPATTVPLAGSVVDDGNGNPPGTLTATWTKVSGPGTVTFASSSSAATTATFSAAGLYELELQGGDGLLISSDRASVTVVSGASGNQAPVVSAGANKTINVAQTLTLAGTASDDGLPNPPAAAAARWSLQSGPGQVTFVDARSLTSKAIFSAPGTYVLKLSANDGALTSSSTMTATVTSDPNVAPVVSAGPDLQAFPGTAVALVGTVTDDGKPSPPAAVTVQWRQVSGPGTATFGNATATSTTATFPSTGDYVLRLTADDGGYAASDDVTVTVTYNSAGNQPPTVDAGPDVQDRLPSAAYLAAVASDDGLPNPPAALTTTWSKISGPGSVTFSLNGTGPAAYARFSAPGDYVLRVTVNDGVASTSDQVAVTVKESGTYRKVFTWGDNFYGSTGTGTKPNDLYSPTWVEQGLVDMAPSNVSFGLRPDGTVIAAGPNAKGQLGVTGVTERLVFGTVPGLDSVIQVGAGVESGAALRSDGSVWTWGSNTYGQLGSGAGSYRSAPAAVPGLSMVQSIAVGPYSVLALKKDGTVVSWGLNSDYQLGDGTNTTRTTPVAMQGMSDVKRMSSASNCSVLLKNDGTVWACGSNYAGELGDGTSVTRSTPVRVVNAADPSGFLSGVVDVATAGQHTLALLGNGRVMAWGVNNVGAVGDGTTTNRTTPVLVRDPGDATGYLTGVVKIAAGKSFSLALKADGTLWAWGTNLDGVLGDNQATTAPRLYPAIVPGLPAIEDIRAAHLSRTIFALGAMPTYAEYASRFFTNAESSNPTVGGPAADRDGDGLSNLLEFYFQTNPNTPDNSGQITPRMVGDRFVVEFSGLALDRGLNVEWLQSDNLVNWTTAVPESVTRVLDGDMIKYQLRFLPATPRFFFRLRMSQ